MPDVLIFDAVRTPRGKGRPPKNGKPGGALSSTAPHELVSGLIDALGTRNPDVLQDVNRLTLGCVGQVGAQGGHIGLVSRLASSLKDNVSVQTLNNYCVSGLTAVNNSAAWAHIETDSFFLAGGVECLSQVGFLADKASYYTEPKIINKLKWAPPIMGAELIATIDGYSKADLDQVTLMSHQRAGEAWTAGRYDDSVCSVTDETGAVILEQDELIRGNMTLENLEVMSPAFAEQGASGFDAMMLAEHPGLQEISHIHSIANCPGMADGAALMLLGHENTIKGKNIKPLARIVAMTETSGDPVLQFTAGFSAMETVLDKAGLTLKDMDRIEFMEAFAAIPLKFYRDYKPDMDKVNVNGGHLAMGHPMGATGAILLASLVHELKRCDGQFGLVVAHAGGGIGSAMIIERVS